MQAVAAENNLSETAFVSGPAAARTIRWFTPTLEVDLCGHATLAAAHVLLVERGEPGPRLSFASRSGPLHVRQDGAQLWLDFPADPPFPAADPEAVARVIGAQPTAVLRGREDLLAILSDADAVRALSPDPAAVAALDARGLIVSAPGDDGVDIVSRYFAPQCGIPEDPVTGSAHTTLTPYWTARLGRTNLAARQLSQRGGSLTCRQTGERVHIGGQAVTYLRGEIETAVASTDGQATTSKTESAPHN